MLRIALCATIALLGCVGPAQAQADQPQTAERPVPFGSDVDSLRGIKTMRVLILKAPRLEGLSDESVRAAVEVKLRQNGISVAAVQKVPLPYLFVTLNALMLGDNRHLVYDIRVEFKQFLVVENTTTGYLVPAVTWARNFIGIQPDSDERELRGSVEELVDMFLNAYLEANPKRD